MTTHSQTYYRIQQQKETLVLEGMCTKEVLCPKIEFTSQESATNVDVASWRSSCIGHHALNNMHQNELERNSLEVERGHVT
jgi:hypothetical protein